MSEGTASPSLSWDRFAGCLLAGAVGDALGADIEFATTAEIRRSFGPAGLTDYASSSGIGHITDDTQMTLFTAEGLLRSAIRARDKGITDPATVVYHAYLRWLITQSRPSDADQIAAHGWDVRTGWLLDHAELFVRRAPGNSCLSALWSGAAGRIDQPVNDSKGCGGVMRVAPIGLVPVDDPFALGAQAAALTHGHPSGYLSAGAFAAIIASLFAGEDLPTAIAAASVELATWAGHEETTAAIGAATALAASEPDPTPEIVERLGGGWVGEEALAIALYTALVARDLPHGVLAAVNHSGDADSTGAMAGNLLGVIHGLSAIPDRWLHGLAECALVTEVATDLWDWFHRPDPPRMAELEGRYPGW